MSDYSLCTVIRAWIQVDRRGRGARQLKKRRWLPFERSRNLAIASVIRWWPFVRHDSQEGCLCNFVATSLAEFQVALPTVVEETLLGALSLAHLATTPGYICIIAATHISRCIALSLIRPSKWVFSSSVPAKLQAQGNIKNQLATYLESGPGSEMSSKSNAK